MPKHSISEPDLAILYSQYQCPIWVNVNGEAVPISTMSEFYLTNVINMLYRRIDEYFIEARHFFGFMDKRCEYAEVELPVFMYPDIYPIIDIGAEARMDHYAFIAHEAAFWLVMTKDWCDKHRPFFKWPRR